MGVLGDLGIVLGIVGIIIMLLPFIAGLTGFFIGGQTILGRFSEQPFTISIIGGVIAIIGFSAVRLDKEE